MKKNTPANLFVYSEVLLTCNTYLLCNMEQAPSQNAYTSSTSGLSEDTKLKLLKTISLWLLVIHFISLIFSITWGLKVPLKIALLFNVFCHAIIFYALETKKAPKYIFWILLFGFSVSIVPFWVFGGGLLGPPPYFMVISIIVLGIMSKKGAETSIGVPIFGVVCAALLIVQIHFSYLLSPFNNQEIQQKATVWALFFLIFLILAILQKRNLYFDLEKKILEGEQAKLQQVIDALPDMVRLRNEEGEIFLSNQSANAFSESVLDKLFDDQEDSEEPAPPQFIEQTGQWVQARQIALERHGGYPNDAELEIISDVTALVKANLSLQQTIEQLKQMQTQLVNSEKMASLGVMTAGITHEINNPLSFVKGGIDVVEPMLTELQQFVQFTDHSMQSEWDENIKLINDIFMHTRMGIQRMTDIVQSMRIFSSQAGKRLSYLNVNECIDATLIILHHQYKNHIIIVKQYAEQPRITCDAGAIGQVFMNLLANAIQAIGDTGQITIATQNKPQQIEIHISDTGEGISEEVGKHIFEPFFTTKPVGVGTGLGLAIIKQIIEAHHGHISYTSEVGNGTTFSLYFPVATKDAGI